MAQAGNVEQTTGEGPKEKASATPSFEQVVLKAQDGMSKLVEAPLYLFKTDKEFRLATSAKDLKKVLEIEEKLGIYMDVLWDIDARMHEALTGTTDVTAQTEFKKILETFDKTSSLLMALEREIGEWIETHR